MPIATIAEVGFLFLKWLGFSLSALLCVAGLFLSCLSISGTWLVLVAACIIGALNGPGFPGWWTLGAFLVASALVEGAEALAGGWGVRRRGGSRVAGFAALVGGFAGLFAGGLIPIPILGSLIGMTAGSFLLAFAVEWVRLRVVRRAVNIAWGAVLARIFVTILKVGVTLGMVAYLAIGLMFSRTL